LFEKTGVARQADLVKLVAGFPRRWQAEAIAFDGRHATNVETVRLFVNHCDYRDGVCDAALGITSHARSLARRQGHAIQQIVIKFDVKNVMTNHNPKPCIRRTGGKGRCAHLSAGRFTRSQCGEPD